MSPLLTKRLTKRLFWFAFGIFGLCLSHVAGAQRIQLKAARGPYFVGEPVELQIVVQGFDQSPQPESSLGDLPDGVEVQLMGVSPRVAESIVQVNGRVKRRTIVTHQFDYQLLARTPGTFTLGPFTVVQGDKQVVANAESFEFRDLESDPDMMVALILPNQPVYEGQRVPIRVEWGYSGNLGEVNRLAIRSQVFDDFEFEDVPIRQGDNALPIQTARGVLQLQAQYMERVIHGKKFTVIVAERTLLAERPGTFNLAPIQASMRKGGSRSTDIFEDFFSDSVFGRRRARTPSVPVRAIGEPQSLTILPLPTAGRPDSFSGAVGQGFRLDVQANRTVVRVGDPISLRITVRGDGNLKQVGLPDLSADGGLVASQFRVPREDIAGTYEAGSKQFGVSVRVKDEAVREIPPLAFSWFDPDRKEYRTTHSQPISMRVMPAQIVSSADVVSNATSNTRGEEGDPTAVRSSSAITPAAPSTAADLAVETDVNKLLAQGVRFLTGGSTAAALYVLGFGAVSFALVDNRRRRVDPAVTRRRQLFAQQRARIRSAAAIPANEAAEAVADALRKVLPDAPPDQRREIESVVADLENLIYAPGRPVVKNLDQATVDQALRLVDVVEEANP